MAMFYNNAIIHVCVKLYLYYIKKDSQQKIIKSRNIYAMNRPWFKYIFYLKIHENIIETTLINLIINAQIVIL